MDRAKSGQTKIDVQTELARVLESVDPLLGESVEVYLVPSHDKLSVWADPSLIAQLVLRLCLSARDALPHGGVITVEARNTQFEKRPGDFVAIRFSCPRFDFVPELASAQRLAGRLGGWVDGGNGWEQGTGVTLVLPLARARNDKPDRPQPRETGRAATVLVVEDASIHASLVGILEGVGHSVLVAPDANQAWAVLETRDIDLVITDTLLPGPRGLELAFKIRARYERLPVLVYGTDLPPGLNWGKGMILLPSTPRVEILKAVEDSLNFKSLANQQEV